MTLQVSHTPAQTGLNHSKLLTELMLQGQQSGSSAAMMHCLHLECSMLAGKTKVEANGHADLRVMIYVHCRTT